MRHVGVSGKSKKRRAIRLDRTTAAKSRRAWFDPSDGDRRNLKYMGNHDNGTNHWTDSGTQQNAGGSLSSRGHKSKQSGPRGNDHGHKLSRSSRPVKSPIRACLSSLIRPKARGAAVPDENEGRKALRLRQAWTDTQYQNFAWPQPNARYWHHPEFRRY